MATIITRPDANGRNRYTARIRLKGHPPEVATFERLTDARKWIQQTESAIREGRHFKTVEAKRHTLTDLVDRYAREVLPRKRDGARQAQQLTWWKEQIGFYLLADCTPALIAEHRDKLSQTPVSGNKARSPASVVRHLAALSHAFTVAVKEWGWLEDNPCKKVSRPKEPRGRVRFLSDSERTRLLSACRESRNPHLFDAVVLSLSTGARQGEILSLRWSQVGLSEGVIRLEWTKNGERRALPLAGLALDLMKQRAKVRLINTDLVFPNRRGDGPADLRDAWLVALRKADLKDFRFHDLRHSAASYLAMNGATLAEIAEVLGHKTLQMVKRYTHLSEQHTAQLVARMNAKLFEDMPL
ncbi:MAG: site-specific integrase [Candidatus Competibacteraceae bacterium]|jgi:integrase|nr:site-specific integrase [Candidatus Competibacteraceae bacterium]